MADNPEGTLRLNVDTTNLAKGTKAAIGHMDDIEKKAKRTREQVKKDTADLGKDLDQLRQKSEARASGKAMLIGKRSTANQEDTRVRKEATLEIETEKQKTEKLKIEGRKQVIIVEQREKQETAILRSELSKRRKMLDADISARSSDARKIQTILNRTHLAPEGVREKALGAIGGPQMQRRRDAMIGFGLTPAEAFQQQLAEVFSQAEATFLAGLGGKRPVSLGGQPPKPPKTVTPQVGGFFKGPGSIFTRLLGAGGGGRAGQLASNILGGLGVGVGTYAIGNAVNAAVEGEKLATSYERQEVAARKLAGGQENLNRLLAVYNKASGGAVAQTDALANTTRLLATGQAKTAAQFEKFVCGTRGASIALGTPETEVQEQTQLAIANTSKRRLDQIGLGVREVDQRIELLRKNNKGWNREMAFSEAIVDLLNEKYGTLTDTIEGQATGVEKLEKSWADLRLEMSKTVKNPVDQLFGGIADLLNKGVQGNTQHAKYADPRTFRAYNTPDIFTGASWFDILGAMSGRSGTQVAAQHVLNHPNLLPNNYGSGYIGGPDYVRPSTPLVDEDKVNARRDAYNQIDALERNFSNQRIQATQQYEEQRLNIIRNYEKSVAREEEDFVRQRKRGLRDYEKQIVDIVRDGQERDAEMRSDTEKQIAEINEDSVKRRAKIEEDYQEQREKAEKDHKDRLLKAAGQLDAIAVLEERKRYAQDNKERKKQHDEALEDEKEATEERRQDALDALNERLEDARKADEKRLADMEAARKQQLADEDEDRKIEKDRAAEDHNDQLEEMARQHDLTMQEIERQYEVQKTALEDKLAADLEAVGIYVAGYHERMEKRDKVIEKFLDDYIDKLEKKFKADKQLGTYEYDPSTGPKLPYQGYASGGLVRQTGRAMVHAGEFVLSRQMMASGWSPNNNYNNQRSLVIEQINISTTPGYEALVGELVEERFIELMESV